MAGTRRPVIVGPMRAGAVQLNATDDADRNLETADRLVRLAASLGAELLVLPATWTHMAPRDHLRTGAQALDGPAMEWARRTAAELGVDLVAGSLYEEPDPTAPDLGSNTSVHVNPDGELAAVYRKIHLFDIEIDGQVHADFIY